jgi:hypothetical protein
MEIIEVSSFKIAPSLGQMPERLLTGSSVFLPVFCFGLGALCL